MQMASKTFFFKYSPISNILDCLVIKHNLMPQTKSTNQCKKKIEQNCSIIH